MNSPLQTALEAVIDPYTGKPYAHKNGLTDIRSHGHRAACRVTLGYPARGLEEAVRQRLQAATRLPLDVAIEVNILTHQAKQGVALLPGVKNIVAVASGKGGVGKSTVSSNLAAALAQAGARVGLLDADIYGPSQPTMLGLAGQRPESLDGKTMQPLAKHGLVMNSIGLLVADSDALVWRGPMAVQALDQLLRQTAWGELDYLIIDLPPGTGDIQLTLAQRVPVTGAVIVSTPQDIALIDARKAIAMFEKVAIPVLGVIENMAIYHCPACGHAEHLFGSGGGQALADATHVPLLGSLPLALDVRVQADAGEPIVLAAPTSPAAEGFRQAAWRVAGALANFGKDYSAKFPSITISKTT